MPQPSSPGEPWLLRSREHSSGIAASQASGSRSRQSVTPSSTGLPSSPQSPYVPYARRGNRPLGPVQQVRAGMGNVSSKGNNLGAGSPLGGRGVSVDADSSLGTSPGTPGD
jgi:hypothetical protein